MIARLIGKLADKHAAGIVLDVNGVGYEVDVPMTTLFALPEQGQTVTLFTHLAVREDAQQLFGFLRQQDRDLFRNLIKVNGIGARTALAMLSTMEADALVQCIIHGDSAMLAKVPGIGKKTAERVILDMRDRLKHWGSPAADGQVVALDQITVNAANQTEQDAISALIALGYKPADASKAIKQIAKPDMSSETLIRLSLQAMVAP